MKHQTPPLIYHWILVFVICLYLVACPLVFTAWAVPQRIISAMPAITEMLYALDLGNKIVGVTTYCNYPAAAKKKPKVGDYFLNLEKVVSLRPDVILLDKDAQDKEIKKFRHHKLNVYALRTRTVKDVLENIKKLGEMMGRRDRSELVVRRMEKRIGDVNKRVKNFRPKLTEVLKMWNAGVEKRKAMVIVGFDPLVVVGGGNFIDDVLKYAGVENVADRTHSAYPQYSFEKLVSENPQYLIVPSNVATRRQIEANKRWRSLEAVRTGRILFIDADVLSRPGPRVVDAIEIIANFIYN
ncbi:MAG: helical backbone metal receptor [Candidatus Margulisiibacteriota bacterium]